MAEDPSVWRAGLDDAEAIGRMLHDFNSEFGESEPDGDFFAARLRELMAEGGDTVVLLGGSGPDGLILLRFRAGLYSENPECYLAELYVVPEQRGRGLGRALLEAGMEAAREWGADHIDLGTSLDDTEARALYESAGFTNREGSPRGPMMLYYEREL